jgi:hypothetical protein
MCVFIIENAEQCCNWSTGLLGLAKACLWPIFLIWVLTRRRNDIAKVVHAIIGLIDRIVDLKWGDFSLTVVPPESPKTIVQAVIEQEVQT